MASEQSSPLPKTMWAYAYQILPPQGADRVRALKELLDQAHHEAQRDARTWTAQVVLEPQITHILVVSDSPEQNHAGNRRLEGELRGLHAGFLITAPLAVTDDGAAPRDTAVEADLPAA
jgi:hypothetical protein